MKTGFSIQGFDLAHCKRTEDYVSAIDQIYNQAILEFARLALRMNIDPEKPFSVQKYPATVGVVTRILKDLASKMHTVIQTGSREQWLYANAKNDAFLSHILDTSKLSKEILSKYQDRNLEALDAFQTRKVNGMDLSNRVWDYTKQFQTSMELGIDVGLGEGRSAQLLSRDLRDMLINPDKLFRRVRDKRGQLQLSKAAKLFEPGQGKYRSSYKNAMRLTRSEINMAYRESDQIRWQQLDFIVGYEIKLSNNHTLNGKPFVDICDHLAGKYPKTFVFKGWHPQCRCYKVPILMGRNEFNTDELNELRAALKGTEYKAFQSQDTVTDVPQAFKDWTEANMERSMNWKSQPYFIKDNFEGGTLSGGMKISIN